MKFVTAIVSRISMWNTNRKNGVKILSDREYEKLCQKYGKIIMIEVI